MDLRSRRSLSAAGGSSAAGRTAALADLLHWNCTELLKLYKEKESGMRDVVLPKERIITLEAPSPHLSADERLWILHSTLHQCLEFLETVMRREEEEFGMQVGGDYRKMQSIVKARLGDLLQSMKLLTRGERVTALASHTELPDGSKNGNAFALKVWIYRVLQELMHWIKCANETLLTLQSERELEPRVTRKRGGWGKHGNEGEGGREREWRSSKVKRRAMEGKVAKGRCKAK